MRRAAALALATLSCAVLAGAAAAGEFTRRGTVTRVIAGDPSSSGSRAALPSASADRDRHAGARSLLRAQGARAGTGACAREARRARRRYEAGDARPLPPPPRLRVAPRRVRPRTPPILGGFGKVYARERAFARLGPTGAPRGRREGSGAGSGARARRPPPARTPRRGATPRIRTSAPSPAARSRLRGRLGLEFRGRRLRSAPLRRRRGRRRLRGLRGETGDDGRANKRGRLSPPPRGP